MSKKMKQILGIYTVAALVTLSLLCAIGYAHLTQLRRTAAYASRASFEAMVRSVDAMGTALQKSLYATDGGLCGSLCGEISASASAAEASLSALPFDTQELEVKNAKVMWPVRIAAAGKAVTPGGAVEICRILGKEETLRRLRIGLEKLN